MKIFGAILCAVSAGITVLSIITALYGDFALAAVILLAGMVGMAAMLFVFWWRAMTEDEMMKR